MVYKKTNKRTYKPRQPKAWYEKKYNAMELAGKAYSTAKYLVGLVNSEKMYYDKSNSVNVDYNGTVIPASNIASGDDTSNRTGNSILAKSLYLQATLTLGSNNPNTQLRLIVIQDKMNTGSLPTWSDIIDNSYVGTGYAVIAPLNIDHTSRYKILYDKRVSLSTGGNNNSHFTKYIPLMTHIKYTGTGATDYYKNNIFIIAISDQNSTAGNSPLLNTVTRLGYHDN